MRGGASVNADTLTEDERAELRDKIRGSIADGLPLFDVISALGAVLFEICEDHDIEPERAIKALSAGIAKFRERTSS